MTRHRLFRALPCAMLLLCCAHAHAQQNLVQNPGFTTDLASWSLFNAFEVTAAWNPLDAGGNAQSGSMRGNLPASGTFRIPIYASQCVAVQPNRTYLFGGRILLPSATTPDGSFATVFANTYANTGCFGNNATHTPAPNVTARDAWTMTAEEVTTGPTIGSIRLHLRVSAPSATNLSSHFDDVFLFATDRVFRNDFEP